MAKLNTEFMARKFNNSLPPQVLSQAFSSPYNDKVLCGNWQENISRYRKTINPMESEYRKEYHRPQIKTPNRDTYYNIKLGGLGTDWHTVNDQGFPEEYYNNFSTLYDLAYNNSCPKLDNKPKKVFRSRFVEYRPQQDMMVNFGNTVNYGLAKWKEQQTKESEKIADIGDALTTNQETYVPPELPEIKKRRSAYKAISSSFFKISKMNPDWKTKDTSLLFCNDIPPEIKLFSETRRPNKILPFL